MARIRTIKPEAFQSESLAAVSLAAERTMFGLSTQADDRGRHPDKPLSINGAIWPERPTHTAEELASELDELAREGILCRYVGCDGRKYLHFVTWDRHQKIERPSKSRYPRCPKHPVSVNGKAEDCGVHAKGHEHAQCPVVEASPNPHRILGEASRSPQAPDSGVSDGANQVNGRSGAETRPEEENPRPGRVSPNPHRTLTEHAVTDLGPRTVDLGPSTNKRNSSATPPTAPEDKPEDLFGEKPPKPSEPDPTPTQRAFGLARAHIETRNRQNTPIVMRAGADPLHAVRKLIQPFVEGGYRDDEISGALVAVGEGLPSSRQLERALTALRTGQQPGGNSRTGYRPVQPRTPHTGGASKYADIQAEAEAIAARDQARIAGGHP